MRHKEVSKTITVQCDDDNYGHLLCTTLFLYLHYKNKTFKIDISVTYYHMSQVIIAQKKMNKQKQTEKQ